MKLFRNHTRNTPEGRTLTSLRKQEKGARNVWPEFKRISTASVSWDNLCIKLLGVTVWCGLLSKRFIRPYFFSPYCVSRVLELDTTVSCRAFKRTFKMLIFISSKMGQPDTATIRANFDGVLANRWIRWRGFLKGPPCSPDLLIPKRLLWGYLISLTAQNRQKSMNWEQPLKENAYKYGRKCFVMFSTPLLYIISRTRTRMKTGVDRKKIKSCL